MAKSIKLTDSTISVTYSELVQLRDLGVLYPGATYRITDYQCSSSDNDTSVASNKFDILVKAIDTDKLSEHCRALRNASDSYFPEETNFEAWEIWYCLDNDTSRFGWASASGKGVIYRLIDEFGNDCPYDFKNIMFKRTASWFSLHEDWCNEALGDVPTTDKLYFTFSLIASANSNGTDLSTNYYNGQKYLKFYQNKIAPYYSGSVQQLNKNVFILKSISDMGCYSNTFGNYCYSNTFGNNCYSNTFGNSCYSNTFGRTSTSLQSYCRYNCLEDGVQYTYFYTTQTTSSSNYLQNITIHRGVKGSSNSSRKTISVTEVNKSYNREYGNNASGTLVNWVANE